METGSLNRYPCNRSWLSGITWLLMVLLLVFLASTASAQPSTEFVETFLEVSTVPASPGEAGAPVEITVQVFGDGLVPTGVINVSSSQGLGDELYCDDVPLDALGQASCSLTFDTPGQYNIFVDYPGGRDTVTFPPGDERCLNLDIVDGSCTIEFEFLSSSTSLDYPVEETTLPPPEILITKTADLAEARPGDQVSFTIQVSHEGGQDANGITVSDSPSSLEVISFGGPQDFSCSGLSCTGDSLTAGDMATFSFVGIVPEDFTEVEICNSASVTWSDGESQASNSATDCIDVVISEPPSAEILSPSNNSVFDVGETVTFQGMGTDAEDSPDQLSYGWTFDDCADSASGETVQVIFNEPQTCRATLTVTNTAGLSGTDFIDFRIGDLPVGGSLERLGEVQRTVPLQDDANFSVQFLDANGQAVNGLAIQWTLILMDLDNLEFSDFSAFGKLRVGDALTVLDNGTATVDVDTNDQGISTVVFADSILPSNYTLTAREPTTGSELSYSIDVGTVGGRDSDTPEAAILQTIDILCPRMAGIEADLEGDEEALLTRCSAVVISEGSGQSGDVSEAAREIAPEELAAQSQIGMGIGNQQMLNITNRLTRLRGTGLASSTAGFNLNIADTRLPADMFSRALSSGGAASSDGSGLLGNGWGMFITGDVFFGDKDETDREAGFDFETLGLTAGIDRRINDDLILGAAVGYATTDADIDSNGGEVDVDGVTLTLYGNYYVDDNVYIDGTLGYGWNDFDTDRNINYTLGEDRVDTVTSGSTDGTQFTASLGAGYDMTMENGLSVNLNARLAYLDGDIDGYDEKDENRQGLNLSYEDQSYKSFTATLGGRVSRALSYEWGILIPELSFEWEHEFEDDPVTIEGNFVNDPAARNNSSANWQTVPFKFDTDSFDSNYFRLGLGASAVLGQGKQLFLRYEHLLGYDDLSQGRVSGGLRLEW